MSESVIFYSTMTLSRIVGLVVAVLASVPGKSISEGAEGRVVRTIPGYVLVDPGSGIISVDDTLQVETPEKIVTGLVRILRFQDGRAGCRIIRQNADRQIRPGDRVVKAGTEDPKAMAGIRKDPGITSDSHAPAKPVSEPPSSSRGAMFGLAWGMEPAGVEKCGVRMKAIRQDRNFTEFETASLPRDLPGVEHYKLLFDDVRGLVKIGLTCRTIPNDPQGEKGRKRFSELASVLDQRLTRNSQISLTAVRSSKPEAFYRCLLSRTQGTWHRVYSTPDKTVLLILHGLTSDSGYIELAVEAVPLYAEAMRLYGSISDGSDH